MPLENARTGLVERRQVEVERGEHALAPRPRRSAHVLQLEHVAQEIAPGQVVGRVEALGQEGEARARARSAGAATPKISIVAAVGVAEVEQALDQRGLARAVHADQAEGLARRDLERKSVERDSGAEALAHASRSRQSRCRHGRLMRVVKRRARARTWLCELRAVPA